MVSRPVVINPVEHVEAVRRVLEKVAIDEMGWPAKDLIANHINGQEVTSVDFVALNDKEILGATKVLTTRPFPVELAFPEVRDIISECEQRGRVVEVALTGVAAEHRGDLSVMLSIYRALYHWSLREGVVAWFSVQEKQITRLYQRLGMPFKELAPGKFYWNGISYPCQLSLDEAEQVVQQRNPAFWDFLKEGIHPEVA